MNPPYRFHLCDVFTDRPFGGNPLAVFPEAESLNTDLMRLIARELNINKTAFVLPPETGTGTHRVRTFSPFGELPAGCHASIGTASILTWIGDVPPLNGDELRYAFENGAAPIEVLMPIAQSDYAVVQLAAGRLPEPGPIASSVDRIAQALSLDASDFHDTRYSPQVLHCGLSCLFVPLKSLDAVRRVKLQNEPWEKLSADCKAGCVYVFAFQTEDSDSDVHCRFLAPALGIAEDPATGCAAIGVASYLAERDPQNSASTSLQIEQGVEIGRPSRLFVEVDKQHGFVSGIRVGGVSVYMGQGEIDVGSCESPWQAPLETGRRAVWDGEFTVSQTL